MKKIKLLITSAALLVGGGLLASSSNNIMKANAAEGDVISTFKSSDVVTSTTYKEYSNGDWIITLGGNSSSVGSNSNNASKLTLSSKYSKVGENISLSSKTAAIISQNPIENVGKIVLSRDDSDPKNSSDDNTKYYVVSSTSKYDTSNADYQIVSSGIFDEGVDISIDIDDSESKYYSIVFTADGWFRLDNVVASFMEGPDQSTKYNVNFYDGDSLIFTEAVKDGDSVDFSLVDTEKEGYIFEGWYEDPKFTIAYDEDAPVTENLNLYARYIAYEDLTSGEIFASETTKTSLIANANIAFESISEDINFSSGDLGLLFENTKITSTGGTNPRVDNDHIRLYADNTIKFSSSYIIESVDYVAIHSSDYRDLSNAATELSDGVTINSTGDYQGTIMVKNNSFSFKISKGTQVRLSSLTIHYSNIPSVSVNSASIRFGTTLDSKLYDKTAKYGVVFGLEGQDLNTLAEGKTTIEELELPYREVDHNTIAKVDEIGALEESETPETAQYFQYAIVVNNMLAHIDEEITAACYMQTADGLYVMDEVTYSLRSLAQKYIDDHVADESIDVLNAIVGYQA